MGTRFELVLCDEDAGTRAIAEAALEEIESLHRRLTRFSADSLLSHINRTAAAAPVRLDRATFALLQDALEVQRLSTGAFDITLNGASDAIELDESACTVRFRHDLAVDLGAIAKGHAIDCAAALLRQHGVESALLHGGTSSIAAIGTPPDADGWKVSLPRIPGVPVVTLRDCTMNVSWPAAQSSAGRPVHIVDPRTGAHAAAHVAVVIGPSARVGDAWATALSVLGRRPSGMPRDYTTCIARDDGPIEWWRPAQQEG
jgi:FAD:protein FMN transferase